MYIIIALALTFICIFLLVSPRYMSDDVHSNTMSESLALKQKYIQMLKDLELDAKTKKISQDEYQATFSQIAKELDKIYKLFDKK